MMWNEAAAADPIEIDIEDSDGAAERDTRDSAQHYKQESPSTTEAVAKSTDCKEKDSSSIRNAQAKQYLRRNKKRKSAPTSFANDDSDSDVDAAEEDYGDSDNVSSPDNEDIGVTKAQPRKQKKGTKRKPKKAQKTGKDIPKDDPEAKMMEEAEALKTIRSWVKDYEVNNSPGQWSDPDPEFSYYSSKFKSPNNRSLPYPATKLVHDLRRNLCGCGKSLASYFDAFYADFGRGRLYCYRCYQKSPYPELIAAARDKPSSSLDDRVFLSPTKASKLFRFDKDGRHILMYETTPDKSKEAEGLFTVLHKYHPFKCLKAAERVHGGFFSTHLVLAGLKEPDYKKRAREEREKKKNGYRGWG